jgi:phage-related protein
LNTNIPGTPASISGTTRACNGNVFTYSVPTVSNATSYNWTAPSGASVISGQGTNSVQIQYGPSFTAAGSISVTASNGCGTSAARTLSISPNTPTQPGTITGTNRACPGDVFTYSVAVVANAQSYLWTAPAGANIINGQGTNSVQIEFTSGFTATGNVSVASVNGCGTSAVRTFSVARNNPAQPSVISGQATGICLSTQNYSITNVNGMTYNWTSPTNTAIVSGQGTNAITLNALTGFTSGNLSVTANNACGTSTARTLALNTLPATPASITGLASGVCRGSIQTYSIANLAGATSYTWTVPSGWSIISGQGTTSIQVQVGTTNGSITARGVNACGSGSSRSLSISTTSCGRLAQQDSPLSMTVMPNPFQSNLQVMLTGMVDEMLTLEMFDIAGRVVASEQVRANQTFDFTPEVANGIYYLSVTNSSGNKETVKIIKTN